jgi:hypothetical protein
MSKLSGNYREVISFTDEVYRMNYKEKPVHILDFLDDPYYLKASTWDFEKNKTGVYPYWRKALVEMFDDSSKLQVVLTGAIGIGKSSIALYALAYIMYTIMLLRNPWGYFSINDAGKMAVSFFNLNKSLGQSRGYYKLMNFLSKSAWFRKQATFVSKAKDLDVLEFEKIRCVLSSPQAEGYGVLGEDIFAGIMDEVDSPQASIAQKQLILEVYNSTYRRFKDRFAPKGYSLGKLFLVTSKQGEGSFIDNFIETMKGQPEVLVYDASLWEAKPITRSGVFFPVAVGNAFRPSKLAPLNSQLPEVTNISGMVLFGEQHKEIWKNFSEEMLREGYTKILDVPIEFRFNFEKDVVGSLRDLAGLTTAGTSLRKLIAAVGFVESCIDKSKQDPISKEEIELGLFDTVNLTEYFDVSKIRIPLNVPRFIHLDISISGDNYCLASSAVRDWTEIDSPTPEGLFVKTKVPIIETDFAMCLKAKEGDRIPLDKVQKFILDLRYMGFNIALVTADLVLLSESTRQVLTKAGIKTESLSLDKTMKPYLDFKDMIYEKRWVCHFIQRLVTEIANLEDNDGKIDHPKTIVKVITLPDGSTRREEIKGTKDLADAVAGSVYSCSTKSSPAMDVTMMKETFQKIAQTTSVEEPVPNLKFTDSAGKEIVGIHEGSGNVQRMADIMRRLRNR